MRNITLTPLSHWSHGFVRVRENWSLSQIKIYVVGLAFFFQTIIKISLDKEGEAEVNNEKRWNLKPVRVTSNPVPFPLPMSASNKATLPERTESSNHRHALSFLPQ